MTQTATTTEATDNDNAEALRDQQEWDQIVELLRRFYKDPSTQTPEEQAMLREWIARVGPSTYASAMREAEGEPPTPPPGNGLATWRDAALDAEMEPYRPDRMPTVATWAHITNLASDLSKAITLAPELRNKPADVALLLLVAHDVGIPYSSALTAIHIIEGKPSMSAMMMRSLVIERGHDCWFEEVSERSVTFCLHRSNWPADRVARTTWTIEQANGVKIKDKPLTGKDNWKNYPRAMLKARATAEGVRDNCPDVVLGVGYTPEELNPDLAVNDEGEPIKVASWSSQHRDEYDDYTPCDETALEGLRGRISVLPDDARAQVATRMREHGLRPLRPTQKYPAVLSVDELPTMQAILDEVERSVVEDVEVVEEQTDTDVSRETSAEAVGVPTATSSKVETVQVGDALAAPVSNETAVAVLNLTQVMASLAEFEDILIEPSPDGMRAQLVGILDGRVMCPECGNLQFGKARRDEARCECAFG